MPIKQMARCKIDARTFFSEDNKNKRNIILRQETGRIQSQG